MGREVRRVPEGWEHPKDERGHYQSLIDESFGEVAREWKAGFAAWERGERPDYCDGESKKLEFWEWHGEPPDRKYYRPEWVEADRTCFQLYETVSEGTPLSPVFPTQEALARWLAKNGDPWNPGRGFSYEGALRFVKAAWAPSLVMDARGVRSGLEDIAEEGENS